jgi:hypothetical protein
LGDREERTMKQFQVTRKYWMPKPAQQVLDEKAKRDALDIAVAETWRACLQACAESPKTL